MSNIINGGTIIQCKNIVFEDGRADMEKYHPGITILPTSEDDEEIYCLFMTTDANRAKKDKDKYKPFQFIQKSYINLKHIIIEKNYYRDKIKEISTDSYINIVKDFYDYQMKTQNNINFEKIREKLEILISIVDIQKDIIKINKYANKIELTSTNIEAILKCRNEKIRKNILIATCIENLSIEEQSEIIKMLDISSKDEIYILKLVNYANIFENHIKQNNYIDNVDIRNKNKEYEKLREYYYNLKCKESLINIDEFLKDVLIISRINEKVVVQVNRIKKMNDLIEQEIIIRQKKEQKKVEKAKQKLENSKGRTNIKHPKKNKDSKKFQKNREWRGKRIPKIIKKLQ